VNILVTGSSGGIGGRATLALREAGHMVRTMDREGAEVNADLRDYGAVLAALDGMEAVVHAGAIANDWPEHEADLMAINVLGTFHLFQGCVTRGIQRVVSFSSVQALGVFGDGARVSALPLSDAVMPAPMTPYQLSKRLGEDTAAYFHRVHGIQSVSLRPVFVAYERHYERWAGATDDPKRIDRAKHDLWAYVDVRDVCDAIERGLTVENLGCEAVLLAAADTLSGTPTADLVARHYADLPWTCDSEAYFEGLSYRGLVDTSHAKAVLGWEPKHSWRR
jgi:UDP-glucose 4-epimerase